MELGVAPGKSAAEFCLNVASDFEFLSNERELLIRDFLYVYVSMP